MLQIHTLPLGDYQTNCYLIHRRGSRHCAVIDPGFDGDTVLDHAHRLGLSIEAILLTHGHFDHVGAVRQIAAETDCRVYLCHDDTALPPAFTAGPLYYTDTYTEGDSVTAAGLTLQVLRTPGHTPGSVCLLCENTLFSGDTLFAGSCGRTDLPGGSWETIRCSLQRLTCLDDSVAVYPGHGGATTIGTEKRQNPYLR